MRFAILIALVASCASHVQQTALRAAYVTVAAAVDAEEVIEHGQSERIIKADKAAGKTPNEIADDVAKWRETVDHDVNEPARVAFKAIAAAIGLTESQAAAAVAAPVKLVVDGLAALKTEAIAGAGSGSGVSP